MYVNSLLLGRSQMFIVFLTFQVILLDVRCLIPSIPPMTSPKDPLLTYPVSTSSPFLSSYMHLFICNVQKYICTFTNENTSECSLMKCLMLSSEIISKQENSLHNVVAQRLKIPQKSLILQYCESVASYVLF